MTAAWNSCLLKISLCLDLGLSSKQMLTRIDIKNSFLERRAENLSKAKCRKSGTLFWHCSKGFIKKIQWWITQDSAIGSAHGSLLEVYVFIATAVFFWLNHFPPLKNVVFITYGKLLTVLLWFKKHQPFNKEIFTPLDNFSSKNEKSKTKKIAWSQIHSPSSPGLDGYFSFRKVKLGSECLEFVEV